MEKITLRFYERWIWGRKILLNSKLWWGFEHLRCSDLIKRSTRKPIWRVFIFNRICATEWFSFQTTESSISCNSLESICLPNNWQNMLQYTSVIMDACIIFKTCINIFSFNTFLNQAAWEWTRFKFRGCSGNEI